MSFHKMFGDQEVWKRLCMGTHLEVGNALMGTKRTDKI